MEELTSPPYAPAHWPPPDPATRFQHAPDPSPTPGRRQYKGRVTAVIVALALLLGVVGYAFVGNRDSSSSSSPITNAPPATQPRSPQRPPRASAPTSPPQTDPATGGSSDPGVASASTTALNVGVVDVNTDLAYQGTAAAGTGIVLRATGEILTNNHVVDGATSVTVTVVSTGKSYKAEVAGTDPTADVALLRVTGATDLETAKIGDSSKVQVGDRVTAVGNAGGVGGAPSVKSGAVTDLDQTITASDGVGGESEQLSGLIQMSARLQPGDSGGPLYNAAGEVIGMNTAGSARRRGAAVGSEYFAIPINTAVDVAKQIETGTPTDTVTIGTPGFLGVQLAADDGSPGVTIAGVVHGTPAEKVGLQEGDVISAVDGQTVDGAKTLESVLRRHHGGDTVSVAWADANGDAHTASVTLTAGPAN